jgi:hypothetical protein
MKWTQCIMGSVLVLGAATVLCAAAEDESSVTKTSAAAPAAEAKRVGTYDSRSVAVAYAGSKKFEESLKTVMEAHKKAKAEGDQARVEEYSKRGAEMQKQMHAMGFGTAPVTEILDQYRDELKALKAKHHLDALVSKWDEKSLGKYPDAEKIDVTEDLVLVLGPNERQKKFALELRDKKPLTEAQLKELEKDPQF